MADYAVQLATRYDGLVIASFPDLPGISALGRDDEEAIAEAGLALGEALATFSADGIAPPEPMAKGARRVGAAQIARPLPA